MLRRVVTRIVGWVEDWRHYQICLRCQRGATRVRLSDGGDACIGGEPELPGRILERVL